MAEDSRLFVRGLLREALDLIPAVVGLVSYVVLLWSLSTFPLEFRVSGPSGGGAAGPKVQAPADPAWDRFVRARQCWDRAFACNIARALDRPDPPLVVGIIGRGRLEWGHGTPFQLADLGITNVTTLLPTHAPEFNPEEIGGIAKAVFRLPG